MADAKAKGGGVRQRSITAVIALTLFLSVIWVDRLHFVFTVFAAILAFVGLYELYAMCRARGIQPETIGGMLAGTVVAFTGYFQSPTLVNLMLYMGCLMVGALHIVRGQFAVAGLSSTIFGIVYIGWFAAHIVLLHRIPDIGPGLVTLLILVVAMTDSGAFFVGRAIGKHKLAPKVSPNKTWEGSVGGFVVGVGSLLLVAYGQQNGWFPAVIQDALPDWTYGKYLQVGALLSVAAQIGDLAESCLKRDAGIKDSGNFFPGHGGALDRCDSFLFTAPFMYYMTIPLFGA
jgi:phosphatidate cytidylyltransferase